MLMKNAYNKAAAVDTADPYAVYDAAYELARAYDKTIAALKASGINLAKAEVSLPKTRYEYTGKKLTPKAVVTIGGVTLVKGKDYKVTYKNNLNAGKASVVISPASNSFAGSKTVNFRIVKGATDFNASSSKKTVKASALKNKKQTVTVKVTKLTKGSTNTAFSISKVTGGQKSKVSVNAKTGVVTIAKNAKKCTIYIKVTSKANSNRKSKTKTVKITVK